MLNHEQCNKIFPKELIQPIINELIKKGFDFKEYYKNIDKEYYTLVNNEYVDSDDDDWDIQTGNFDWHNIEVWRDDVAANILMKEKFKELDKLFSPFSHIIDRVMYHVVSPNTVVPIHVDKEQNVYKIIIPVCTPSLDTKVVALKFGNEVRSLPEGVMIGCHTTVVPHGGWNYSNKYWSMLSIHLKEIINEADYL